MSPVTNLPQASVKERFNTLLDVVKAANKFSPQPGNWKFCLETCSGNGSRSWRPFGVVLPEVVEWLKQANSEYLDLKEDSKEVRLKPPVKNGKNDLDKAWSDILDKLDAAGRKACSSGTPDAEIPKWVRFKTKFTYTRAFPKSKEVWPLIGAGKGFEDGIWVDVASLLGVATSGAHLNVWTKTKAGLIKVCVSRRPIRHPNFQGLDDQAVAGGFTPGHKTIKDCIAKEKKQEAKGLPRNSNERMIECHSIQFFDTRDERWEEGHTSLPEPGIRKVFDLEVGIDEIKDIEPNEDQASFKQKTIKEIIPTLLANEWKPNCALVMIDFMIRHELMPNAKVSGDVDEIKNLLRLKERFHDGIDIPVVELAQIKNNIKK